MANKLFERWSRWWAARAERARNRDQEVGSAWWPWRFLEWVFLGSAEGLPSFFAKRQKGLYRSYENSITMLLHSLAESAPENMKIAALIVELERLQTTGATAGGHYDRFRKLLALDARIVAAMPDDFLIARRWLMLDRFRRVAPQRAFAEYESSFPPSTDKLKTADAKLIRDDLLNVTNYIQQLYTLGLQREYVLASIKWWLFTRSLAVIGIIGVTMLLNVMPNPFGQTFPKGSAMITGLLIVFLMGNVGAVASISRKFQDIAKLNVLSADPINEIVSLNAGRQSVAISILSGGIFALLAYLFFVSGAGGLLGADLAYFPSTSPDIGLASAKPGAPLISRANDALPLGIAAISRGMGFVYAGDLLRMMLFGFVAGFAERLIPDSIDRLIKHDQAAMSR